MSGQLTRDQYSAEKYAPKATEYMMHEIMLNAALWNMLSGLAEGSLPSIINMGNWRRKKYTEATTLNPNT